MGILDDFNESIEETVKTIEKKRIEEKHNRERAELQEKEKLICWKQKIEDGLKPISKYFDVINFEDYPSKGTLEICIGGKVIIKVRCIIGYENEEIANYDLGTYKTVWKNEAVIVISAEGYTYADKGWSGNYSSPEAALEKIGKWLKGYMVYVKTGERIKEN